MAPELSKAALGLYPLIPTYAVDCDDAKNRQVCAEQVRGLSTYMGAYTRHRTRASLVS